MLSRYYFPVKKKKKYKFNVDTGKIILSIVVLFLRKIILIVNGWKSSTKFFLIFSYFAQSEIEYIFDKWTRRKAHAEICALRRLNGVLFTVAKLYLVETKEEDDTEKRGWKTCKIDAWDEVFEINCAKFRISTQREREWGKHWMYTDSFERLKCCLFPPQFLFDSTKKENEKKIN